MLVNIRKLYIKIKINVIFFSVVCCVHHFYSCIKDILQFQRPESNQITWIDGNIIPAPKKFSVPDFSKYEQMSIIEIF